ncbi:hypothetical protein JQN72_04505 [Phycicoccus sp. CSK15P-2]|uniref:glycosyltransferase family protein n=1 Tax=Phycicoccus sp. CSK15P-2 TaxID=2807627 RepID=UPI0019528B25|nr:hypothetical protein [Phycicoccus sp. CSK15P-2]MBM6403503.1 hypothetical protein [Phycicoccus sp. CSK15P-2]
MSSRPFRVLVSAYVDLNVIDGSAFFVSGVASLLTSAPGMAVHVVTATPIRRPVVIQEMLLNNRVTVTDPFRDVTLTARLPELADASWMDEQTSARVLSHYLDQGHYDVIIVRSTEVAHTLAELHPDLGRRLCVYVTGVVASDADLDPVVSHRLGALLDRGATLLCQTPEMREHLLGALAQESRAEAVALLSPAVPSEHDVVLPQSQGPLLLTYTGKFAPAWHTVEMLAAFKEASSAGADLRLVVAGDHFKRPPEWPSFVAEVRYLLGSHPGVSWVGAVTRADARALVAGSDVGIGWRNTSLDSSLELSTKLLEHGVLGRPCVINPTPMHRRLFGDDYPLFAASTTQFVDLLQRMDRDRAMVRDAARTAQVVSADYTYETVFRDLFPTLLTASGLPDDPSSGLADDISALCATSDRLVRRGDQWVGWLTDSTDGARILHRLVSGGPVVDVERLGPFVRFTQGPGDGSPQSEADQAACLALAEGALFDGGGAPADVPMSAEVTVAHDAGGRVRLAQPVATVPAPGGEDGGTGAVTRAHEQELATMTARYEALAGTVLGRLQRAYWRLRRRVRRRGAHR